MLCFSIRSNFRLGIIRWEIRVLDLLVFVSFWGFKLQQQLPMKMKHVCWRFCIFFGLGPFRHHQLSLNRSHQTTFHILEVMHFYVPINKSKQYWHMFISTIDTVYIYQPFFPVQNPEAISAAIQIEARHWFHPNHRGEVETHRGSLCWSYTWSPGKSTRGATSLGKRLVVGWGSLKRFGELYGEDDHDFLRPQKIIQSGATVFFQLKWTWDSRTGLGRSEGYFSFFKT